MMAWSGVWGCVVSGNSVYQIDIQTNLYGVYITNVYHVLAGDLQAAGEMGVQIAQIQANLIKPSVFINRVRASVPGSANDQFYSILTTIPGTRAGGGDVLPEFCRYRVDFNVGYRRPLRKFLLWPEEAETTGGGFYQAAVDFVNTQYIQPLLTTAGIQLCGPTGLPVLGAALNARVGMRQLRRASKRKTPIIP